MSERSLLLGKIYESSRQWYESWEMQLFPPQKRPYWESGRTLKMCGESHWSQVKSPPTPLFTSNSWLQCKTDSGKIVPVHVRARQIPKWLDLPMESLSARTICMNADQPIAYTYRYSLFAYHIPTWTDYIPSFPVWARTEFFSMCVRVLLLGPYT